MGKKIVKVCEWITAIGSGTWIVPKGCKTIDIFLCSGGVNGASASSGGGNGGNGGGYKNVYKFGVSTIKNITFSVGAANVNSTFGNITASTGSGPAGGTGATSGGNGGIGASGIYPFDNNKLFKRFCSGGGGGGYSFSSNTGQQEIYNNKSGGSPNGGGAKSWYFYDSSWAVIYGQEGYSGRVGQYYGAGGGGGGLGHTSLFGGKSEGSGGAGYQGCIILIYERQKLSTDIVDSAIGIVKVNWPNNV